MDFPIPPEIGHAWLERLPLAEGVSPMRGIHRFRLETQGQLVRLGEETQGQLVRLGGFSTPFPETTLCIQMMEGGIAHHREFYPPAELRFQLGHDFSDLPIGFIRFHPSLPPRKAT